MDELVEVLFPSSFNRKRQVELFSDNGDQQIPNVTRADDDDEKAVVNVVKQLRRTRLCLNQRDHEARIDAGEESERVWEERMGRRRGVKVTPGTGRSI